MAQGKIEKHHWIFAGVALVLSGMTLVFHGEQFIQWKATIIYALFDSAVAISQLLFKTNLVQKALMGILSSVQEEQKVTVDIPSSVFNQLLVFWAILL